MKLTTKQTKQVRDLLYSLVNKSSVSLLRYVNAEQKQLLDLFLSNPEWNAWRSQTVDIVSRDLIKIVEREPATKVTRKRKVNRVDNVIQ